MSGNGLRPRVVGFPQVFHGLLGFNWNNLATDPCAPWSDTTRVTRWLPFGFEFYHFCLTIQHMFLPFHRKPRRGVPIAILWKSTIRSQYWRNERDRLCGKIPTCNSKNVESKQRKLMEIIHLASAVAIAIGCHWKRHTNAFEMFHRFRSWKAWVKLWKNVGTKAALRVSPHCEWRRVLSIWEPRLKRRIQLTYKQRRRESRCRWKMKGNIGRQVCQGWCNAV